MPVPPSADLPPTIRPLPPSPDLALVRKEAKRLLRAAQAGDPAVLRRADSAFPVRPARFRLANAQFVVAREYGFASWPKLVAYFTTWERHARSQPARSTYRVQHYRDRVDHLLAAHNAGAPDIAPFLATYVPADFGKSDAEIFATPLSRSDAELAVARREGFVNWDALLSAAARAPDPGTNFAGAPFGRAQAAINDDRFDDLRKLVARYPELLRVATSGIAAGGSIASSALYHERQTRSDIARAMTDWLASQGADVQGLLNRCLIGWLRATRADVEWAIARGADFHWTPPNGISLLEHVLLRCWNPGPADLIASLVPPRSAFWIASGLGDVDDMRRYFTGDGPLTAEARRDRPDFAAVGMHLPCRPGVDDRDILWEAFLVAGLNHRAASIDFLLARGFPIDYSPWKSNLLHWAVGNRVVPVVEMLIARGADLDVRGRHPDLTAREMVAQQLADHPDDPAVHRIAELCRR
jgi:hypothetical protein